MLSGMVKLVLAKMNMSTVITWFGGQGSDAGMNLLQQYITIETCTPAPVVD
jgi:hypothetical protein